MKRSFVKIIALGIIGVLFLIGAQVSCKKAEPELSIDSWYINYHAHINFEGGANDFHVWVNNIDTSQIWRLWYGRVPDPHGNKPAPDPFPNLTEKSKAPLGNGVLASWYFEPSAKYCTWLHFGIHHYALDKEGNPVEPEHVIAWWTRRKLPSQEPKPVAIVSLPLPTWKLINDSVIRSTVKNPVMPIEKLGPESKNLNLDAAFDNRGDVVIGQSVAISEKVFKLEELMWENEEIKKLAWDERGAMKAVRIQRGNESVMDIIDSLKDHHAIVTRYWVYNPVIDDTLFFVIAQAEIKVIEKKKENQE